jgi:ABC-type nitrate/sulfonate/bicarbonate transport system substrate-binding protein
LAYKNLLRMGPSCYHVLHLVPPTIADELNLFVDEGLRDADGNAAYQLVPDSHAPFMFERLTLWQTMKERGIDVTMDVKPSTIAHLRQQGKEIYVIAGWRNYMPFFVLGPAGTSSLKEIAGKRVGIIDLDDILVTMLSYWLIQEGLDPAKDIEWVTGIDTRRGPGALRDGRVDVAFCDQVDIDALRSEGYAQLLDVMEKYPNGRPDRVIAATGRAIDERPEQIQAFVKAMIRAYWFVRIKDNFPVTQAMERRLRRDSPDEDERARMAQFGSAAQAEMMPFPIDGLPTGFDQYLAEAQVLGNIDGPMDPADISKLDFAKEAFMELSGRPELAADLDTMREVVARIGY